ncbi:IclR family transcriptional regulator [Chitinophaga sp.]|uniref:IclR family transcriptional regulator n=1 Tax=Chitinophaga sp. TaxID=1869181 RepID=UPI0031D4EE8C
MIQVINRAIDILEYLAAEPERPKPLGEIAGHLNLNEGTCANIIKTLVHRKFVDKLEKRQGYCLGARAYALTGNEGYKRELIAAAKKEMEKLTGKLNENSVLAVLNKETRLVIASVSSTHPVQAVTNQEKRAYDSASGRLLIGMLPETELLAFLEKYGLPKAGEWEEAKDKKSLLKETAKIRQQGYAMQKTAGKIVGLAVPVYLGEKVVASLSVYLPDFRYKNANKNELIDLLAQAAEKISRSLG